MTFGTAIVTGGAPVASSSGGGGGGTTGITDRFNRAPTAPYVGGMFGAGNWGFADSGDEWQGSSYHCYLDGATGVIGLEDVSPLDGSGVYQQIQILPYPTPSGISLNITMDLVANRATLPQEVGVDPWDGEVLEIFVNEFGVGPSSVGKTRLGLLADGQAELGQFGTGGTDLLTRFGHSVVYDQPFHVAFFQIDASHPVQCWLWQASDPKPSSPIATIPGWGFSNHAVSFELITARSTVGTPLEFRLDNLDIDGRPSL